MIPLKDENPTRTFPSVVILLIAANVVAYLYQSLLPDSQQQQFVYTYGAIPVLLLGKAKLSGLVPLAPIWLSVFTAMFFHGGLLHLGSNMLYLWIFGNNVEDTLGRLRFLLFYLFCGTVATMAHVFVTSATGRDLLVPSLGASGAISGVLGAYLLLFPRKRVRVLFTWFVTSVPAVVAVGVWFVFQLINGLGYLGGGTGGGVAYAAHIGGFVAGFATVKLWAAGRRQVSRSRTGS